MPTKPMNPIERMLRARGLDALTGCWNWILTRDRAGYGRLKVQLGARDRFRMMSAHRYAFELWRGQIPDGMNVLHTCDNRSCFNPDHLFLGTQQDNMRDMHAKNRGPRGYTRDSATCAANARQKRKRRELNSDAAIDAAMKGTT